MKPPSPKTVIFDSKAAGLGGRIPGPIRVEVVGETIWAAGGHDFSGVLRFAEGRWTATEVDPLLNFVLAISDREAIIGGADGRAGRTIDGGLTWTWQNLRGGWLICASRDRDGRVWVGQEDGRVLCAAHPGAKLERVAQVRGTVNTVRQISPTEAVVVTEHVVHRMVLATGKVTTWFETDDASLIDGACDAAGRVVLVADGGHAWLADDGKTFVPVALDFGSYDFDAVFHVGGWFTALGYDGALRVSRDGRAWRRLAVERGVTRLGGIAAYRGGWLVGGLRVVNGEQVGTLAFLGDPAAAPILPAIVRAADRKLAGLTEAARAARFVIAERNALLWATTWSALPDAEAHAAAWMKLAAQLQR